MAGALCRINQLFQSTPAIAGGRIPHCLWRHGAQSRFNPRPPLLAGESIRGTQWGGYVLVSIHARHCWRANPLERVAGFGRHECFNPRPPLLAGESWPQATHGCPRGVSIHARHCWRANPADTDAANGVTEFQSTPAIAGGRIRASSTRRGSSAKFQSTPAIAGGRIPFARNALPRNGFCWYLREPGGAVLCFA